MIDSRCTTEWAEKVAAPGADFEAAGHAKLRSMTGLGFGRYGVLAIIMLMYLALGCVMDAMAMIILTIPIIFPVISALGFDPIWFGVIIVMTVELGLIHPPVGMNVFVIKSVVRDVRISTIFLGVIPFVITDILRLVILISFPIIATYLPQRMG